MDTIVTKKYNTRKAMSVGKISKIEKRVFHVKNSILMYLAWSMKRSVEVR